MDKKRVRTRTWRIEQSHLQLIRNAGLEYSVFPPDDKRTQYFEHFLQLKSKPMSLKIRTRLFGIFRNMIRKSSYFTELLAQSE